MKPKPGDIRTGGIPKTAPEGTRWVPVGPVHPEKGVHQRWELQEVRTFEQMLEADEIPFSIPPELQTPGQEVITIKQTSFLDRLGNFIRGERE